MNQSISELSLNLKRKIKEIYDKTIGRYISQLFKHPSTILFLGIDFAGKTTLLTKLKYNTNHVLVPTSHSSKTELQIGNFKASVIDIGGHAAIRFAWKTYFHNIDGIVFQAWKSVLEIEKEAPILVLMNKVDKALSILGRHSMDAALEQSIQERTGISTQENPGQNVKITYLSIIQEDINKDNTPLRQGFAWLSQMIDVRNKTKQ